MLEQWNEDVAEWWEWKDEYGETIWKQTNLIDKIGEEK